MGKNKAYQVSHTCTDQIHVFRCNPRSRCNSSSRCCYRAREHVDRKHFYTTKRKPSFPFLCFCRAIFWYERACCRASIYRTGQSALHQAAMEVRADQSAATQASRANRQKLAGAERQHAAGVMREGFACVFNPISVR